MIKSVLIIAEDRLRADVLANALRLRLPSSSIEATELNAIRTEAEELNTAHKTVGCPSWPSSRWLGLIKKARHYGSPFIVAPVGSQPPRTLRHYADAGVEAIFDPSAPLASLVNLLEVGLPDVSAIKHDTPRPRLPTATEYVG
jgi:hypothetical protein